MTRNPVAVIAELSRPAPASPGGPDLSERWGPSLDHDEPSIDVPADHWRWRVANLPHDQWACWRRRSSEIGAEFSIATGQPLDAGEIVQADYAAAVEMGLADPQARTRDERNPPDGLRD